jgi:large subunit ribosomal protein L18
MKALKSKGKKQNNRDRRRARIRAKISGTAIRPRLSVFKSNTRIYAQLIDDESGVTMASASGVDASKVGVTIAKLASAKGVKQIVFDRGGYFYTGKVEAPAESARAKGLEF